MQTGGENISQAIKFLPVRFVNLFIDFSLLISLYQAVLTGRTMAGVQLLLLLSLREKK